MSEPLKSCPFCGHAEPIVIQVCSASDFWWEVSCPGEECFTSKRGDTEPEAIAAWNRRAPPPPGLMLCSEDDLQRVRDAEPGSLTPIYGIPAASRRTYDFDDRPVCPESHLNAEEGE